MANQQVKQNMGKQLSLLKSLKTDIEEAKAKGIKIENLDWLEKYNDDCIKMCRTAVELYNKLELEKSKKKPAGKTKKTEEKEVKEPAAAEKAEGKEVKEPATAEKTGEKEVKEPATAEKTGEKEVKEPATTEKVEEKPVEELAAAESAEAKTEEDLDDDLDFLN
ncbi:MAG: hypothetical protein ACI3ZR_07300 [bacterium]